MFPLALAIPELTELSSTLLGFFGAKKVSESKDRVIPLFPFTAGVAFTVNNFVKDSDSENVTPIFDYKDFDDEDNSVEYDSNFVKFKMIDNYLSSLNDGNENAVLSLDLHKVVKQIDVPEIQGGNLLDTMKSNTQALVSVLTALNNSISSNVVSGSITSSLIAKSIDSLVNEVSELKKILVLNGINNVDLVDVLSRLKLNVSVNNDVSTPDVKIQNNVDLSSINTVADILDTHLSKVAEAKELEKENYEYMKTPQTYTLTDESLPKLAPRDVIALSEAVKAHLNSQEASLTGEELSDFENDFDLGDVLTKLFNFKGITEDINKLPKE